MYNIHIYIYLHAYNYLLCSDYEWNMNFLMPCGLWYFSLKASRRSRRGGKALVEATIVAVFEIDDSVWNLVTFCCGSKQWEFWLCFCFIFQRLLWRFARSKWVCSIMGYSSGFCYPKQGIIDDSWCFTSLTQFNPILLPTLTQTQVVPEVNVKEMNAAMAELGNLQQAESHGTMWDHVGS